jgi:Mg-chelatase subunit ChlD
LIGSSDFTIKNDPRSGVSRSSAVTDLNASIVTPSPENKEGKDQKADDLVVAAGRIALPEAQVSPSDSDAIVQLKARFADTTPQTANEFAWAAPSGGGGGGLGGSIAQKPPSIGPQGGQTPAWFDQNNKNLFFVDTLSQSTRAGDVSGPMKLPEQPPAPVDPATGLPVLGIQTTISAGSTLALTPPPPATLPPPAARESKAVEFADGTNAAGTLGYGLNNYMLFAESAPRGQAEGFQRRLGNIVNRAAASADIVDFDTDGAARGFNRDGSRGAQNHEWEMAKSSRYHVDRRRSEIALPSQPRGDVEKQVAAVPSIVAKESASTPAPALVEQFADIQDQPTSEDAVLGRELDSLRQARERLTSRIIQETVDAAIPRSGIVEMVDPAEAKPVKSPTVLERIGGAFSSGVERNVRVRVEKDAPDVQGLGLERNPKGFDPYWVQTEMERIQSRSVLSNVAQKLNLNEAWGEKRGGERLKTEDTLALLKKKTAVTTDPKSGLIDIKVRSDNAEEAARIANTIAEVYRDQRLSEGRQFASRGVETLQKEQAAQNQKIAELEQDLARRQKEKGGEDIGRPKPTAGAGIPQPEVFTAENPFSTFSLNVSDVSFKLAQASLEKGALPEPATVRTEEFINAFDYRDPEPSGSAPIAFAWERARYPFAHDRDLVRFSVKTAASGRQPGRPLNLVLLLDNSGSMERADRLRIRQECLRVLASQLQTNDRISVVAFARTAQLWVDGLAGNQAGELPERVGSLTPQGGTNLEEAMNLAYRTALRHFLANGVNRVVLLTDGAANLGDVEPESLKKKVEANRQQGIALDCFGIGWEGYNDDLLEVLSRNGDGRYGFVNTPEAASSEFAGQLAGALKVAASDVKVQVEFNPNRVTAYRQMGYAKHQLKKEQFRDNTVDAAEIGAAEAGNALYVVQVNPGGEGPLGTVRVRFKVPGTSDYREHEWPVPYDGAAKPLEQSAFPMRLATTAAAFSEWLVSSPYAAEVAPDRLLTYLSGVPESCPADPRPKQLESMIRQAKSIAGK